MSPFLVGDYMNLKDTTLRIEYIPIEKLTPNKKNARAHHADDIQCIKNSIEQFGMCDPIGVWGDDNIIVEGQGRLQALKELGYTEVPTIRLDFLTDEERRAYGIAHNKTAENSSWNFENLNAEMSDLNIDFNFKDFGFKFEVEKERQKALYDEFKNGMTTELAEDESYNEFVEKFKPKKTTDDCYTPPEVYDAVLKWVKDEYSIDENRLIVRPFVPGGDYINYEYPQDCVVVDNPPFSIMAQIVDFYLERKIDFFLFANGLTLFGYGNREVNLVCVDCSVIYENGAKVNTGFATNMGDYKIMTAPKLKEAIELVNKPETKEITTYQMPDEVITAARINFANVEFKLTKEQCRFVRTIGKEKTQLYGAGFLISPAKAKAKAEAEAKAIQYIELSDEEKAIIEQLSEFD